MSVYTSEFLKELQDLPLERKIMLTQNRIIEWYNIHVGKVAVSFSGGKDSTVLLHIARQIFPDLKAVFCNTGLEYPEIVDFVKTFDNVDIIRPKKTFKQVLDEYGWLFPSKELAQAIDGTRNNTEWCRKKLYGEYFYREFQHIKEYYQKYIPLLNAPFKISDKCCHVMKKAPLKKYEKHYKTILATMTEESMLRKKSWIVTGCNGGKQSKPMSFWLEKDIIEYIQRYKVPYCSIYGEIKNGKFTGANRTGCIFCLAGVHLDKVCRFKLLKRTHPKLWEYCMKPKDKGGLGMQEVLEWINENVKVGVCKNGYIDYGQNDLDIFEGIE